MSSSQQTFVPPGLKGYRLTDVQAFASDCVTVLSNRSPQDDDAGVAVRAFTKLKRMFLKPYPARCVSSGRLPRRYPVKLAEDVLKKVYRAGRAFLKW